MTLDTLARQQLRTRAQAAISRPVPLHVRDGGASVVAHYKDFAGVLSAFVRTGRGEVLARSALVRIECMQGVVPVALGNPALLNGQSGAGML